MTLTSKQVDAVTYAYLDICAAADLALRQGFVEFFHRRDRHAWDEISEAVPQTKVDLEKAFPFLLEK